MNPAFFKSPATAAAMLLAVCAAGVFFALVERPGDLLVGTHAEGSNDLTTHFLRAHDTARLLAGHDGASASWNPLLGLGMPIQGNPQIGIAYPPNWIARLAGAELTLSWIMIAHLWLAGVGSFALARYSGLCWPACLLSGVAGLAAPYAVAHLGEGHYAQICTIAWVPWILLCFERFLDSDGRGWKWMSLTLGLCFLAGHVQELYYLVLMLSGVLAFEVVKKLRTGERRQAGSLLIHWGLAGIVTGGLVAVDLIPVWLNTQLTARSSRLPLDVAGAGLRLENLRQLINPLALGGPDRAGNPQDFYWTSLLYFGVIPLILAAAGALIAIPESQRARSLPRRMTWLTIIALLFAFGTRTPLYGLCYRLLPLIGSFRIPARILFPASFFVAFLAGAGLHALLVRSKPESNREAGKGGAERLSPMATVVSVLLILGTAVELGWHARQVLAVAPQDSLRRESELTRFLTGNPGHHRVLAPLAELSDHECLRAGIPRVRGYEPVLQRRLVWLIDALNDVPDGELDFAGFRETDLRTLRKPIIDLGGIRYFASTVQQPAPDGWRRVASFDVPPLVSLTSKSVETKTVYVYENENVMPRAFVVGRAEIQDDHGGQSAVDQLESINPRETVILPNEMLKPGPRSEFVPAEITRYRSDFVEVAVETQAPGYLILTDLFHPGWTATLDGEPTEIIPANLAFRAVVVPAGSHTVRFEYRCPGRQQGLLLTVATLVLLSVSLLIDRRRTVRSESPSQ